MGKGWNWPKDCGKGRKKCELYSEDGKVVPIKIENVLIRRQKRAANLAPARVAYIKGELAEFQTPCFGTLKLKHPKCDEAALKRHQPAAPQSPH
jgi:hypothetical protein